MTTLALAYAAVTLLFVLVVLGGTVVDRLQRLSGPAAAVFFGVSAVVILVWLSSSLLAADDEKLQSVMVRGAGAAALVLLGLLVARAVAERRGLRRGLRRRGLRRRELIVAGMVALTVPGLLWAVGGDDGSLSDLCATVYAAAAALLGLLFLSRTLKSLQQARASRGWPTTPGRVRSATVEHKWDSDMGTSHIARVEYTYTVAGRSYRGEHTRSSVLQGDMARLVGRYPARMEMPVYYDPTDPRRAVLDTHVPSNYGLFLALSALLLSLSAVFVAL